MITVKAYAIRQKSTGYYMPMPTGRNGRGGSYKEPVPVSPEEPARLFRDRRAATISLKAWLKGIWRRKVTMEFNTLDDFDKDPVEDIVIEPQDNRKAEDMEVVPVELFLP